MKVQFTETVLRDASQSLIATRMPIKVMEPILETLEDKFATIKNGKGISFAVPLSSVIGVNLYQFMSNNRLGRE